MQEIGLTAQIVATDGGKVKRRPSEQQAITARSALPNVLHNGVDCFGEIYQGRRNARLTSVPCRTKIAVPHRVCWL
jgi:hypothetical protein